MLIRGFGYHIRKKSERINTESKVKNKEKTGYSERSTPHCLIMTEISLLN